MARVECTVRPCTQLYRIITEARTGRVVKLVAMPSMPVAVSGLKPGALGLKEFTFQKRTLKLNWRDLSQLKLAKVRPPLCPPL